MIHGVAILRASQLRAPIETTTNTASVTAAAFGGFRTVTRRRSGHAAFRGRERSTARADLPQALRDLAQGGPIRGQARLLRGACDLAEEGVLDDGPAAGLLEGGHVGVGDPAELMLAGRPSRW